MDGEMRGGSVGALKGLEFCACLREGEARLEASDDAVVEVAIVAAQVEVSWRQRYEEKGFARWAGGDVGSHGDGGKAQARWQHTNDRSRLTADAQGLTDGCGISLEKRLPAFVTEDHDACCSLDGVAGHEVAAEDGLNTEDMEKVGGH